MNAYHPVSQRSSAEIDARSMKDGLIIDALAQMLPPDGDCHQAGRACDFLTRHGARLLALARACHTEMLPPE